MSQEEAVFQPLAKLGENLRIADLAQAAGCSQDTLRRLENGDPGVSLGVLARVLAAIGCAQELALMMDAAKDSDGLKAEVQRLPQRVRRPLPPQGNRFAAGHRRCRYRSGERSRC